MPPGAAYRTTRSWRPAGRETATRPSSGDPTAAGPEAPATRRPPPPPPPPPPRAPRGAGGGGPPLPPPPPRPRRRAGFAAPGGRGLEPDRPQHGRAFDHVDAVAVARDQPRASERGARDEPAHA